MKFFWLLSDDKTVREITHEKYRKLASSLKHYRLAIVWKNYLQIQYGKNYVHFNRKQLEQILG